LYFGCDVLFLSTAIFFSIYIYRLRICSWGLNRSLG
jgi:hypothetical protein